MIAKNKEFKILQFTDIHIGEAPFNAEDMKTFEMIDQTLKETDADLICITGDLIWSHGVNSPTKGLKALAEVFNKYDLPIAITYGNHDSEETINRQDLHKIETEYFKNIAKKSNQYFDANNKECFTINVVRDDSIVHVLYFIDSGADALIDCEGYDWVSIEQIQWYEQTSADYLKQKENTTDLMFLHIPLPEYENAGEHIIEGKFWEMNPRIASAQLNTGLFSRILYNNHIEGIFCGHDHDNNFEGTYLGKRLIYGNVTGYNCYGVLPRGYREIKLTPEKMETTLQVFEKQ
ncbi:metallophosphoesterase family protein [Enterococcus sp.]|uniref:metallophosphoesterase family protein n=1 Tax=Enterococcus sp. TaxID=35783 RepID=UPI002FC6D024